MTTQEIVKALRCCKQWEGCDCCVCVECSLYTADTEECEELKNQAADLIESLTAELETTRHQLEQAKQERNAWKLLAEAAVNDFGKCCAICKYNTESMCVNPNGCLNISGTNTGWEWRGPCAENGGDIK